MSDCEHYFVSRTDTPHRFCTYCNMLESDELTKLKAQVKEFKALIKQIQEVMFAWQVRKMPIQFCEVGSLEKKNPWQDCCDDGPVWDWVQYRYRVKE